MSWGLFLYSTLLWAACYGDLPGSSSEGNREETLYTVLIILGAIPVIQIFVCVFFAYRGWEAVCRSSSSSQETEPQWPTELPFLPSYDMAMTEIRTSQQSVASCSQDNIDNGVILDIRTGQQDNIDNGVVLDIRTANITTSLENSICDNGAAVGPSTSADITPSENRSNDRRASVEASISNLNPPSEDLNNIDNGVILEIRAASVTTFVENSICDNGGTIETSASAGMSSSGNRNNDRRATVDPSVSNSSPLSGICASSENTSLEKGYSDNHVALQAASVSMPNTAVQSIPINS